MGCWKVLGNIAWIINGGLLGALEWMIVGCLWCITIVGIPFGKQCFKMAELTLNPFGKTIRDDGGAGSVFLNVIWILFTGVEFCLLHALTGVFLCVTLVGIPFGLQHFKIAYLSLLPFGKTIEKEHDT